jgi:hypothetical protein
LEKKLWIGKKASGLEKKASGLEKKQSGLEKNFFGTNFKPTNQNSSGRLRVSGLGLEIWNIGDDMIGTRLGGKKEGEENFRILKAPLISSCVNEITGYKYCFF